MHSSKTLQVLEMLRAVVRTTVEMMIMDLEVDNTSHSIFAGSSRSPHTRGSKSSLIEWRREIFRAFGCKKHGDAHKSSLKSYF